MSSHSFKRYWSISLSIVILLLLASIAGAADTDWGGTLQTYVDGGNVPGRELTFGLSASIWSETDFSQYATLNFNGGYGFQIDKGNYFNFPELQLLAVSGRGVDWSYKAGRFTLSDRRGKLFNAILDGGQYIHTTDRFEHRAGAGFTGLPFNRTSRVIMTAVDQRAFDNARSFSLASPRIGAYYEYTAVFEVGSEGTDPKDQTFSVAFLGEFDLRSADAVVDDNPNSSLLHSGFIQAGISGRMSQSFDYSFNGILQAGANVIPNDSRTLLLIGGLVEASVSWAPGGYLTPLVTIGGLYSSGDPWTQRSDWEGTQYGSGSSLNQYTAFTTRTVGYVFASRVGNLNYAHVGGSIRPANILSLLLDNYTYFRSVNGPVNELPIDAVSGSNLYLGNEIILTVHFRPFSDLGLKVNGGIFLANGQLISEKVQYRLGALLSMSF